LPSFHSMGYRCLICNVTLESPRKLEIHLQIEHKWGRKRESNGLDMWSWFGIL